MMILVIWHCSWKVLIILFKILVQNKSLKKTKRIVINCTIEISWILGVIEILYNPYKNPIANDINTEICEQIFAWLAQHKNIVRGFNESTFLIYIYLLCDVSNDHNIKIYERNIFHLLHRQLVMFSSFSKYYVYLLFL
jgi:hypothetical protein